MFHNISRGRDAEIYSECSDWTLGSFFRDLSVSMDHSLRSSLVVSKSVICVAGVKRVEGVGWE